MIKSNLMQLFVRVFMVVSFVSFVFASQAQDLRFVDDTLVSIPEDSPVKLRWTIPPSADSSFSPVVFLRNNPNFTFSVDKNENVWIGYADRLICMSKEFAFRLSEPFQQMIQLDNGAMVFSTMLEVGFAKGDEIKDSPEKGLPVLPFQAFARFPEAYAKILPFTNDSILAVTEKKGKTTAYLLESDKGENSLKPLAIRAWKKLFEIDSSLGAMTWVPGSSNGKLWFSIDNYIYLYDDTDHSFSIKARLPADKKIRQLAATRDQLFYATENQVGIIGPDKHQVILQTPFPKICCRNEKLFVLLTGCMGVIEVENISSPAKIIK
ncbi:MAG: hypothetical protein Kow0029_28470 [Candidatus Rifleibacteriota bacterium]